MNPITLLVLANPAEPELALLDELRGIAVIVICDTPAAWESLAPQAEVILNWMSGTSVLQQVWPMMARLRWVHTRSAGLDGILFPALWIARLC